MMTSTFEQWFLNTGPRLKLSHLTNSSKPWRSLEKVKNQNSKPAFIFLELKFTFLFIKIYIYFVILNIKLIVKKYFMLIKSATIIKHYLSRINLILLNKIQEIYLKKADASTILKFEVKFTQKTYVAILIISWSFPDKDFLITCMHIIVLK